MAGTTHNLHRLADMSAFTESIPDLKQRINQLQTRHTGELEKLCAHQAAQYLDDALDQYMAQNDEANGGYSADIDVCCSQDVSVNVSDVTSRSCIISLAVGGGRAWKPGLIAKRHWCASRM
jgi:hypothetical protein